MKRFLRRAKLVVLGLVALYLLAVVIANGHPTFVNLLVWKPEPPLVVLLLAMLLAGFVAGMIVARRWWPRGEAGVKEQEAPPGRKPEGKPSGGEEAGTRGEPRQGGGEASA